MLSSLDRSGRLPAAALAALALTSPFLGAAAGPKPDAEPPKVASPSAGYVTVRLRDNSTLKMTIKDESVELATKYGKMRIPVADIVQIDFATRVPPEVARKIDAAIGNLGSKDFDARQAATAELEALREQPYHALVKAAKDSTDPEVVMRAKELIEKIRDTVPAELLEYRADDVVVTADSSKFIGRLDGAAFKANTAAFGDVPLNFAAVRSLQTRPPAPEIDIAKLPPAPQHMHNLAGQIGKTFVYRVTGANNGAVWGTDVYTSDSDVATVAVHAGIVKVGETGIIKITIVAPPPAFGGSTRNGVTTAAFNAFPGAYTVSK
jgi:hypothetical protein